MAVTDKQEEWWRGLHLEWDNCPDVRARLRSGGKLLLPHPCLGPGDTVERSIHNCRYNKAILIPALTRWKPYADSSPSIDCLFEEVNKFYKLCLRTDITVADVHADAWALRKLLGLVKAQCSKSNVPQESRKH